EKVKKIVRKHNRNVAKNSSSCCSSAGVIAESGNQKTLKIVWQRLISDDKTCPRCGSTEEELDKAASTLKQSLSPLGIEVTVEKKELSVAKFKEDPLQSNRIWFNNHPLEDYIGGNVGQSPCCDVCGPSECRTVDIEGQIYETIPSKIIIQAGLVAGSQLVNSGNEQSCCSSEE
ncbi:MAG: DUF2703 domain-containing protein, partial [Candidatus Bathyarchaeota archaeon]